MLYASYRLLLFIYLFKYLFIPLSLPQFGYISYHLPICIFFTTSRFEFISHLLKQIRNCYIVISDIVH